MKIVKVKYLDTYRLQVLFDDGKTVVADFRSFLLKSGNPMTTQFRSVSLFKKVKVWNGHLTWMDGEMDISAESVYSGKFDATEASSCQK
jgi:hypothetical protein